MKRITLLFGILCFCNLGNAQQKNEKEERIRENVFPKIALQLLRDHIKNPKNLKYYRETDSLKMSYEAKFKLKERRYSVEFSKTGDLEDVEVLISKEEVPVNTMEKIQAYLKKNTRKYHIERIQKQYVNTSDINSADVLESALNDHSFEFINYEMVIWISKKDTSGRAEFTFDHQGDFVSERSFVSSYDHVRY
ncbi:hypothetical protein [Ascidiimonas aurantiaca]|uniref:hypothetical protein n=1 Tax=Ascidiimonas aurantiaca TaxID=1685432 RepID=UPI0030EC2DDB